MINASASGRLGKDAEYFERNGKQFVKFSIASRIDKDNAQWINCTIWGKRAESLASFLLKGSSVYVSGELALNKFTKDSGEVLTSLDLNVHSFDFCGGGKDEKQEVKLPHKQSNQPNLDDIPF